MPQEYRDATDGTNDPLISDAIDLGSIGGTDGGGSGGGSLAPEPARAPGKRKGRPPGSKNAGSGKSTGAAKEKTSGKLDLSSLTGLFVGLHVIAAGASNVPELAIDMQEGDTFMKSAQNVMRHYSVESSQKTIDWLAFGGTVCMIYGTRFGAYMLRRRSEQQEQHRTGATVYQMPVRPPAPQNAQPQPQPETPSHVVVEMEYEGE